MPKAPDQRKKDNNRPNHAMLSLCPRFRFRYHQKPERSCQKFPPSLAFIVVETQTPPVVPYRPSIYVSAPRQMLTNACMIKYHESIVKHQNRLAASAEVTTGGKGHLDCGVVISPKGGSAGADLGVYAAAAVWHDRALSALCLSSELAPGELAPLLRRTMRTCSGDIEEACIGCEWCETCGRLWLWVVCAWE